MKFFTIFAALLAAFLCGCNSWIEEPIETKMTFAELEKKMRHATDPYNRGRDLKSYQMHQIITTERLLDVPEEKFVTMKYLKPGYFFMISSEDAAVTAPPVSGWIVTPDDGWLVDYEKKKVEKLTGDRLLMFRRTIELDDFGNRIRQSSANVKLDACRVNGKEYYKLICQPRKYQNESVTYYVDQQTYLIRRMVAVFILNGVRICYTTDILSYTLKDGIRMPEKTLSDLDGIRSEARLLDYKVDPEFTVADFTPPIF